MVVWLIQIGEPLPLNNKVRKQRMSLLTERLLDNGHIVHRLASAYDHITKRKVFTGDKNFELKKNLYLHVFDGGGYSKNISISRIIDHYLIGKKICEYIKIAPSPDVIIVATPPHNIAYNVTKYAKSKNIKVIVDIRDQWPDIFLKLIPRRLKKISKKLLYFEYRKNYILFKSADGITAMMNDLLEWGLRNAHRDKNNKEKVFYIGTEKMNVIENPNISHKFDYLSPIIKGKKVFTFIGTFNYSNNPSIIIDVAEILNIEGYKNAVFLLAGDGDHYKQIEKRAKNLPNVKLLGWLSRPEIDFLLKKTDVGIVTLNHFRPVFSNKVFIYFSAFLPIIASTPGELKEIMSVNNIGLYYEPNDRNGLYSCVKKVLLEPSLLEKMKKNVEEIFPNMFDSEVIYSEFVRYIERIAVK